MAVDKKIYKNYISPIDQKLTQFDQSEPLSASQLAEIRKYQKIYDLRDHARLDSEERDPTSL